MIHWELFYVWYHYSCFHLEFFQEAFKERPFLPVNGNFEIGGNDVKVLNVHSIYAQGHANVLEENIQKLTDKDKLQVAIILNSILIIDSRSCEKHWCFNHLFHRFWNLIFSYWIEEHGDFYLFTEVIVYSISNICSF